MNKRRKSSGGLLEEAGPNSRIVFLPFPLNSILFASPFFQRSPHFSAAQSKFKPKDLLQIPAGPGARFLGTSLLRDVPGAERNSNTKADSRFLLSELGEV